MNNFLITIVGPTAIGKTTLSIQLATYFNTEIISCDSRQFYKEMCIGTAVPGKEELAQIKHHFIQNRSVVDDYSVGQFEKEAIAKLNALYKDGNCVVMVGGSGLYIDAVLNGLDAFPKIDAEIRKRLKLQLSQDGIEPLQSLLKEVDPETYQKIDIENGQRVIRALEVYRSTGRPFSSFLTDKSAERNFIPVKIGLTADREIVYERINHRVELMFQNGLLNEAKTLFKYKHLNALQTVGYKELFQYLNKDFDLDFAKSEIKKNTRRFAKRQGTWFKKDAQIKWFDFQERRDTIIKYIEGEIKTANRTKNNKP